MRKALNENPVVQICVVGVLLVFGGIFVLSQMGGGGSSGSSGTSTSAGAAPAPAATPATGSVSSPAAPSASPTSAPPTAAVASAPSTAPAVSPAALVPGPGLPKPVLTSYEQGNVVVLLIVRNAGIDDKLVQGSVEALKAQGDLSVFVAKASQIARYSRITQGVGVSQVPALVVVRPRVHGSSVPEATVTYGFTTSQGVVQAVHDALYKGPDDLPYDPKG